MLAYFHSFKQADAAAKALNESGFPSFVDKVKKDLPNPDFSVSELMVGFLPDLAHGIFGSGRKAGDEKEKEDGAFLLIIEEEQAKEGELRELLRQFGGELIREQ
jgi:hypothetical protein